MTNPERNTAPAVKYRVGSLGDLCLVADIRDEEHLYELRTLTGVEWYDAAGNWTQPPALLPEGLPVPPGSSPGTLHLTDEEARMVAQPAGVPERKSARVEIVRWTPSELVVEVTGRADFVPPDGWEAAGSDWNGEAGEASEQTEHYRPCVAYDAPAAGDRCAQCRVPQAKHASGSAPTGHVRLAWLAVMGAVALLLAAPVAVADPPPAPKKTTPVQKAPRPDAGTPDFCPASNWPCDCPGNPDCTIKPG